MWSWFQNDRSILVDHYITQLNFAIKALPLAKRIGVAAGDRELSLC